VRWQSTGLGAAVLLNKQAQLEDCWQQQPSYEEETMADRSLLEGDERVLWGCLALLRVARIVETKKGAPSALAFLSLLFNTTVDSVVAKGIISEDEMAQILGHPSAEAAGARIDEVIQKLSDKEAMEAMEVWDAMKKLEPEIG
jgi:hypothetical protein